MKIRITRPCRVNLLSGEVEVTPQEYNRLKTLRLIDVESKEVPEVKKRTTRKAK